MKQYQRPVRMSMDTWLKFNEQHINRDNCFVCAICGLVVEPADFSGDHIIPQSMGGTDDLSNWQPSHMICNSRKNANSDKYWLEKFYFDQNPNMSSYRYYQSFIYEQTRAANRDLYLRPFSTISGNLYVQVATTGAGKTNSIIAKCCAINHLKNDYMLGMPRIDRILILVRSVDLREQLADEIERETVEFDILPVSPRVGTITKGDNWNQSYVSHYDVIVACVQQLWDKNERPRNGIEKVLAHFPAIFIDENHFGNEQVQNIVKRAYSSLVFGLTATPIDARGDFLRNCVLTSIFNYNQAADKDHSLKYVPDTLSEVFHEVTATRAFVKQGDKSLSVGDPNDPRLDQSGYNFNIRLSHNVISEVVQATVDMDALIEKKSLSNFGIADHRIADVHKVGFTFYPHVMVKVDEIKTAQYLRDHWNDEFSKNRGRYPEDKGYNFALVCSDESEDDLNNDHSWLRSAKKLDGGIDANCCRFLLVVDQAREGINNPYCLFLAYCCSIDSIVEAVQRIGRTVRSQIMQSSKGLLVAPEELDRIKVFSHKRFGNANTIQDAIDYIRNMDSFFYGMSTVDDILNSNGPDMPRESDTLEKGFLSTDEKLKLANVYGNFPDQEIEQIIHPVIRSENTSKIKKAQEWIRLLKTSPRKAATSAGISDFINEVVVVDLEERSFSPSKDELVKFLQAHYPNEYNVYISEYGHIPDTTLPLLKGAYKMHKETFSIGALKPYTNTSKIQANYAREIINEFQHVEARPEAERKKPKDTFIHMWVMVAIKDSLYGLTGKLTIDSAYDVPEVHALLQKIKVKLQIKAFVRYKLISSGYAPSLAIAFDLNERY